MSETAVRISGLGVVPLGKEVVRDTSRMAALAAEECLASSPYERSDIELLIFAGMLRTGYICEPAIATLIAGELEMNHIIESERDKKTLAFDVYNGAMGLLNACRVATAMIQAGDCRTAMIIASEVEVNSEYFPDSPLGLEETASAFILDRGGSGDERFGRFVFRYFTEHFDARRAEGFYKDGKPFCRLEQDASLHRYYLECIPSAVRELLDLEGLEISNIKALLPPQFSAEFNARLAQAIGAPEAIVVNAGREGKDLFSSSFPYSLERVRRERLVREGDIGLVINVASGIQVGCATYHF